MGSPRVLLFDEMMTGLAPRIVQSLGATVASLADEGVAVLLAEPSIGPAYSFITRGYVLIRGDVVASEEDGRALDAAYQSAMGVELARTAEAEAAHPVPDVDPIP